MRAWLHYSKLLPALLLSLILLGACSGPRPYQPDERQAKAMAMWRERCKTAGEKIYKKVEGVEGVYLMKIRPTATNYGNQYELSDPFGDDVGGDGYIMSFLRGFYTPPKEVNANTPPRHAYLYVEAQDPKDGQRYRYTGGMKVVGKKDVTHPNIQRALQLNPNFDVNNYGFVIDKVPAPGQAPRYGVTYDDISTREEREYWIAGSSLKVVDLQTSEVIAERIGYMVDWAQGSQVGGRSPWLLAANNACPQFADRHGASAQTNQTEKFVEKVLKPTK